MLKSITAAGLFLFAAAFAPAAEPPGLPQLKTMTARFSPTELVIDTSKLSAGDRGALVKLIEAARVIDEIFLEQTWSGNRKLAARLKADTSSLGRARWHYFWLNKGPWSEIDGNTAFLPGVPPVRLPGSNCYPEDMTKAEYEKWFSTLSKPEQEEASGFYSVIRRDAKGGLVDVPFSREYRPLLERAGKLLREAARLTRNASLRKFLNLRADAFLSNEYVESDIAWMDLDSAIDPTIGPYETYDDEHFGYKAAFEAYIHLRDPQETEKVAFFSRHLQEIEDNLPEDPKFRVKKLGAASPIAVVNEVYGGGQGNRGIQSVAYNLPNDDRVVQQKGAKRVMIKNINRAKFEKILIPISKILLPASEQKFIDFESFFTWILSHELTHGLGPHEISVDGRTTNPRLELKEIYGSIEEAKADVTGIVALQFLMDKKLIPGGEEAERKLYTNYLASAFRTLHFGLQDAHARGQAVQFNYLMDKGAYIANLDGTFSTDYTKIKGALSDLDRELLTLEATGDYAGAKKMLTELAVFRPVVQKAMERLASIPNDIEPIFVTAGKLAPERATGKKPSPRPAAQ
jgi:hypothetical protein